jgi:hypothetical protein
VEHGVGELIWEILALILAILEHNTTIARMRQAQRTPVGQHPQDDPARRDLVRHLAAQAAALDRRRIVASSNAIA